MLLVSSGVLLMSSMVFMNFGMTSMRQRLDEGTEQLAVFKCIQGHAAGLELLSTPYL